MEYVFRGVNGWKKLDYIACWFYLGALYSKDSITKFAFVSTNSICQGEQVALLWPSIFKYNIEIFFAVTSFKWSNNAKEQAAVICIIVGLSTDNGSKYIFHDDTKRKVEAINPYLTSTNSKFITPLNYSISNFPSIVSGSKASDFGYFMFDRVEKINY